MFEHSLVDLAAQKKRRSWLTLPFAIAIHLLVAGSVAFASYWNISDVPEPTMNVVFFESAAPAAAAGSAGNPAPKPPAPTPVDKPVVQTEIVQPPDIPDELPPVDPGPSDAMSDLVSTVVGIPDGSDVGVPGSDGPGVPGSDGPGNSGMGTVTLEQPVESQPIRVGGAVTKPVEIYRTAPRYTEPARRAGVQGMVVLEAIIDERGLVVDVKILRGLPMGLDQSAAEAVQKWRYQPATLHGKPVKVYFTLTVNFTLQR